ncbi:mitochondrial carrier protein [Plasmodium yoelii]|uniref:Citrate/oxoglutarate carrier protein n=3 Tax=Plasmodium yoelii TaxID=5861 RepID=A0AAE9WVL1_PLAYO|nr:mitochondrial carrier protein [Plasmodium yoelii]EAA19013.1 Mitochondrial carrier protein, putative [Plasmodium yoelii yoelii]WBY61012.1 citrate/oxoglutarate carrier protein [Plasmodium yoelii yoelii]CDU20757.1 mitochondrial carrier protein, putative [Plasmodium yoelii]VTZ81720.1 citrate/oxoglutarate carrier protein, putative [Plasmodium yoelii]|eukprot:XP_727448.1 mitochondrial carrier protein [Plasmodium yoelii]
MEKKNEGVIKNGAYKNLISGSFLHCLETGTLGLPLEVWKTRMCIYRNENTINSFINIYNKGVGHFYGGFYAKLVESSTKGAVLLLSKEKIIKVLNDLNVNNTISGFIGGACGGICQSIVMTPCTFFITASIDKNINYKDKLISIFKHSGISTLYKGNSAMCLRQGTNWASRQGITEWVRNIYISKKQKKNERNEIKEIKESEQRPNDVKICDISNPNKFKQDKKNNNELKTSEEIICGIIGGSLSVWNNPFDVIRVYMQNNANKNINLSFTQSFINLYKEGGILYLYKGVIPRCFLCIWQTLFMVTGIKIINNYF